MMISSSVRKIGFTGIATLLLVSGLTTSAMTVQAAGDESGSMTLLQSPAPGSLSSLGGVSGYIASQSGGDTNAWLTGQGIDPSAAGPITDTTIPSGAQGKITIDGGTASLSSDADGVGVGYLVGDAQGTDAISASLTNLAIASGHDDDTYPMTGQDLLAWMNGTQWTGHYTMTAAINFDFVVNWSLDGPTITPDPDNAVNEALASQFITAANSILSNPSGLPLQNMVTAADQYQLDQSSPVAYSFAYAVGQGLAPGSSVSVDLPQVVSQSPLNDLNSNDQTSGTLSEIPLSAWLSDDTVQSLSALQGFTGINSDMTTADMTGMILTNLIAAGDLNEWGTGVVTDTVEQILDGVTGAGLGYTMNPLADADKAILADNTPSVLNRFLDGGFADTLANGISADISLTSAVDPGTVTSLIPTGVTYTAQTPIEVDTDASTLTLTDSQFLIDPNAVCTGASVVSPATITATATVVDTTGAPVVGTEVTFGADSALALSPSTAITDGNGVATTHISLSDASAAEGTTSVTAHVGFGSGADLTPAQLSINRVQTVTPAAPSLSVVPSGESPVMADGLDSYTASITFMDICGPQAGVPVDFSVTNSAQLSPASTSSNENGLATAVLTDTVGESVTVTATSQGIQIGQPVTVEFTKTSTDEPSETTSPTDEPSETTSPTDEPSETTSPTDEPTETPTSPTPSETTTPPCTGSECAPLAAATGILAANPTEVSSNDNTVVTATVLTADGLPAFGAPVTFQIGGNAQFSDGTTITVYPADSAGVAAVTATATTVDCDNPGFDVYASIMVDGQMVKLSQSPVRVTVVPPDGACEVPVSAPEVKLANATIIAGNATPGATVQVVTAAGTVLGTSGVDMTGYWFVPTPAGTPSQQIVANALNSKGVAVASTTEWLDTDLPAPAKVDRANTQEVAGNLGSVESSATLTVIFPDGTMIKALANADGSYSVTTPAGMALGQVTVIVTDTAGNPSAPTTVNLVTYVPPVPPTSAITVTVKNAQVEVGGQQTVTGKGFRNLERVTAQLCSTPTTCTTVGSGLALLNGQVSITFTVPDSTTTLGTYTVTLTGTTSGTGSTTFQVIAPAAPPTTKVCAYLLWWAKWWWVFA